MAFPHASDPFDNLAKAIALPERKATEGAEAAAQVGLGRHPTFSLNQTLINDR